MSRVTVNMNEILKMNLEKIAEKKSKSVSKFVSEAVEYYITELKKKELGNKVLNLIGNVDISSEILEEMQLHRDNYDRS